MRFQHTAIGLACATLLAACGGGGSQGDSAGLAQSISFPFPGGPTVAVPPAVTSITLKATASSGLPVTYVTNTPDVCSVSDATVSLLKAGECSVNANQAGGDGFAPATTRQLFVVPKGFQTITGFLNPGAQAIGASVTVAATSSVGAPITFSTSTPTVCSVTGTTVKTLADGLCLVTATQPGTDYITPVSVTKTIVVGTAQGPAVSFTAGYKPNDIGRTAENGKIDWYASDTNKTTVATDGSTRTFTMDKTSATAGFGGYFGIRMMAPTLESLLTTGDTTGGVRIDSQKAIKFGLRFNQEMIDAQKTRIRVWLYLGHFNRKNGGACNVTLEKFITPVLTTPMTGVQEQSIDLKTFTFAESCGLTNLDAWNELQNYPISKLEINVPDINNQKPNAGTTVYSTSMTTGKIYFQ
ncbi:hypothetical protein [Pseudoduganella namucuonensis]|uniref:Uncharacterized protein n=1 Tax=Pseudoduganella namucuonensis TaxID=1035707 RepID=A0A1I7J9G9_9BURK|nr:hypothetical protein [Pseudoduganella namucuonensis]SFU81846.1 hypothetical protein SAMN05216552_1010183 [Pseudoduganella namucuonensis]